MRVLIIENEIYLAQSIAMKLEHLGFDCDITTVVKESHSKDYDVVLLSTNLIEQNIYSIISLYKESVIILMISYISDDTVTKPIKAGAKDYILKPFMIDELVRKIQHYYTFQHLKQTVTFYRSYVDMTLDHFITEVPAKLSLPLVLQSRNQKSIDAYVIF
ncbi:MAG: response regulator, partial [Helicobacter sp.]|nr:response regulator [Helicobacter sp.]